MLQELLDWRVSKAGETAKMDTDGVVKDHSSSLTCRELEADEWGERSCYPECQAISMTFPRLQREADAAAHCHTEKNGL